MVFQGGLTLVERVVYWNPPLCYAYDTQGKVFPLQNYIGLMGVVCLLYTSPACDWQR